MKYLSSDDGAMLIGMFVGGYWGIYFGESWYDPIGYIIGATAAIYLLNMAFKNPDSPGSGE